MRNEQGRRTRENLPFLIQLFKERQVPITWATVGHLFLERCSRSSSGLAHADMPRPPKNGRCKGDWYIQDPCSNVGQAPYWYCPDLITQIIRSGVNHEIGTHTFSHIDFSTGFSNRELVAAELDECIKVMKPFGMRPTSLVFPHGNLGYSYLDILAEKNITAVRHRDRNVFLSYPVRTKEGVYKIFESLNTRRARYYDYFEKVRIFLEQAFKTSAVLHLWFHPSDPHEIFADEFKRIIEYAADVRRERGLWIATMADIASYCEARERLHLDIRRDDGVTKIYFKSTLDRARYGEPDVTLAIHDHPLPQKASCEVAGKSFPLTVGSVGARGEDSCFSLTVPEKTSFIELTV
ncbi:MAG TPA: polysaccharide deacetylase family protein [Chitinivibrionales bacterium]|nr:polysaccharide deacetylase family protein [Chitinivibrionales bacterium]